MGGSVGTSSLPSGSWELLFGWGWGMAAARTTHGREGSARRHGHGESQSSSQHMMMKICKLDAMFRPKHTRKSKTPFWYINAKGVADQLCLKPAVERKMQ